MSGQLLRGDPHKSRLPVGEEPERWRARVNRLVRARAARRRAASRWSVAPSRSVRVGAFEAALACDAATYFLTWNVT